jgi:hypothetical protein
MTLPIRFCLICRRPATYEAESWTDFPEEGTDGPARIALCEDHRTIDEEDLESHGYFGISDVRPIPGTVAPAIIALLAAGSSVEFHHESMGGSEEQRDYLLIDGARSEDPDLINEAWAAEREEESGIEARMIETGKQEASHWMWHDRVTFALSSRYGGDHD